MIVDRPRWKDEEQPRAFGATLHNVTMISSFWLFS
jgi:hypothetical protein